MTDSIGSTIRQARKAAGLSLPALARITGLTTGLLSQVETGVRADPRLSTLVRIAAGLGVSVGAIIDTAGLVEAHGPRQPHIPEGARGRIAVIKAMKEAEEDLNQIESQAKRAKQKLRQAWHEIQPPKKAK